MTRRLRRQHSGEVKARAVLEALEGKRTINEIASVREVHPVQVTQWKKQAKESLAELFSRRKDLSVKADAELKERLYQKIGRLEMELDWLKKSLAWDATERRGLIEPMSAVISLKRQCELVGLSRSGWYYEAVPEDPEDLRLKRLLDEQCTRTPFYGGRRMTVWLQQDKGEAVNLKRVRRLMTEMGLEAVYAKPRLSLPDVRRPRYPYLLRNLAITRPNHVWATDISAPCRRGWRQTNYAGWLPTGSWNAAPLGKDSGRKGAAKLRQVPMAGCHKQSSLNSTGRGPLPTSRATIGSMVRQRSVRRKPLYLEQPTLNDGMAWRDCGAIRWVLMLPTEGCARRIRRWDVL